MVFLLPSFSRVANISRFLSCWRGLSTLLSTIDKTSSQGGKMESIRLINYQCFADNTFVLKPLTLLSGLDGTGKTALLQSILLLKQSYETNNLSKGLLLNGRLVSLGAVGQVLRITAGEDALMQISVSENGLTSNWKFRTWNKQLDLYPIVEPAPSGTSMVRGIYYLSSCQEGRLIDFSLLEKVLPGSIVLIEHPEFGLHNSVVTAITSRMARAVARGVQIIVETHSDHILQGIRVEIHQGRLDCKNFNCLHFSRTGKVVTDIQEILWDRRARTRTWPENFFDEWDKSLEQLLEKIDE
jgi:predicted ATPase